ncbi:MAG: hypothetical protein DME22_16915 [Verrucomicrobia bacterium]|nr:MAG: hypothetical protein DME22_16915 [Verrucomicrobiota bacterium]PYJ97371.1 MAG: hypothetical protein DME23_15855 [Verrucomicrobiota bacterium]
MSFLRGGELSGPHCGILQLCVSDESFLVRDCACEVWLISIKEVRYGYSFVVFTLRDLKWGIIRDRRPAFALLEKDRTDAVQHRAGIRSQ